jgi:phosphatidylserine decarboxylase
MSVKVPKIAPEGYPFIIIFAVVTIILFVISTTLGWVGIILTFWCASFFRDPERTTPVHDDLVISPADGLILKIHEVNPPEETGISDRMIKISIFMNVFNVHINRIPCNGTLENIHYIPGKFFNASLDKASTDNERQIFTMNTNTGHRIAFVQIAGLIARRIIKPFVGENAEVTSGEKISLIRFGSRVDLYLPLGTNILVGEGQTTLAGETIIADLKSTAKNGLSYQVFDRATPQSKQS